MTHLFLTIEIREGEYEHTHKILLTTECKNLEFAAQYYTAHYWGYGTRDFKDEWWWWYDHCGRLESWEIVPKKDYKILKKYL